MKIRILLLILLFILLYGLSRYLFNLYTDYYFNQKKTELKNDLDAQLNKIFNGSNKIVEAKLGKYYPDTVRIDPFYLKHNDDLYYRSAFLMPENDGFQVRRKYFCMHTEYKDIKDLEVIWSISLPTVVWEIKVLEKTEEGYYVQYSLEPIAVGYKKLTNKYEKAFRPSLYDCCKNQFKYITENDEEIKYFYNPSQINRIVNFQSIGNKYYYLSRQRDNEWSEEKPKYYRYEDDFKKREMYETFNGISYIHNYYYKAFYAKTFPDYYNFYFNQNAYDSDFSEFNKKGLNIILLSLIIIFIFPIYYTIKKGIKNKIELKKYDNQSVISTINSPEFELLLLKCSPKNFMNPYDAEKVALANKIYSSILTNQNNTRKLNKLKKEAEKKLNIIISD